MSTESLLQPAFRRAAPALAALIAAAALSGCVVAPVGPAYGAGGYYDEGVVTAEVAPPARETWPDDTWPRWNGIEWTLTGLNKPSTPADDPLAKLQRFLAANPDVVAAIGLDPA